MCVINLIAPTLTVYIKFDFFQFYRKSRCHGVKMRVTGMMIYATTN